MYRRALLEIFAVTGGSRGWAKISSVLYMCVIFTLVIYLFITKILNYYNLIHGGDPAVMGLLVLFAIIMSSVTVVSSEKYQNKVDEYYDRMDSVKKQILVAVSLVSIPGVIVLIISMLDPLSIKH